ncbi:MAG: hypothetical protein MK179_05345, partial [Pirellulaceae bacterium]|nr:hypothetical protein [Pirellulaceae bacterium]
MRVAVFTSVTLVIVAVIAAQVFRSPRELLDEQDMTASEVLRGMIQKYQQATSYSDQGVIRVTQISAEQQVQQSAPFAVQFERSGRLRVRAYEILLASDGKRLRARYMDPSVPDLSRQTLDVAAPSEMDLAMLQFDNFLWEHLDGGMGGLPVSLRLLLDSDALADVFAEDVDLELQTPQMIGDDRCYVVGAKSAGGAVEFWVDAKDFILRRFEYPALDGFRLRADFVGASWQVTGSDGAFQLPKQEQVRRVTHFVIPPQPLPTKIFGQAVNRFEFREVGGELISATQLAGINKVLVWFNDHPSCREVLSLMQRVADSQENHQKVRFLAVWAEGAVPGDEELHRLLESWQVDLPLVRDLGAFGRDAFGVPAAPTTVVLDTNNRVQVFEVGVRPDVEEFLPGVLH